LLRLLLCVELGIIWLIYYGFGVISTYNMPIWATAILVILVDRTTSHIKDLAARRRDKLQD